MKYLNGNGNVQVVENGTKSQEFLDTRIHTNGVKNKECEKEKERSLKTTSNEKRHQDDDIECHESLTNNKNSEIKQDNKPVSSMEVDAALSRLGNFGRWQLIFFIILSMGFNFPGCWHVLSYLFQAYTPPHHCKVPPGVNVSQAIPWDYKTNSLSSCYINGNGSHSNETVKCSDDVNDWDYYGDDVRESIVTDWNLVCDKAYLKKTTSTVNAFGILWGTMFFSPLIDYFGRRKLFLCCQWLMVIVGTCNAFVYNYYVFCVVRFLTGFIRPGFGMAAFILACELFPAKQRTFAGIIIEDFWGIAICILAVLMYLIENWRYIQLGLSLFGLLTVPLYWFLPESIPWLVTKGRLKEAEEIIQKAARVNGIKDFPEKVFIRNQNPDDPDNPDDVDNDVIDRVTLTDDIEGNRRVRVEQRNGEGDKGCCGVFRKKDKGNANYSVLDVLRHPKLRWFTFVSATLWFINSTVYYGMTLNTEELAGNRYINLFVSGIVEIPAYTMSYFIIKKWGRRLPLVAFHIISGIFLLLSEFVPKETANGTSLMPLQITFVMLGKFCITSSYGIVYLYAPELFPTTVRSQCMGIAAVCGRIGGMVAPFTSSLNDIEPWLTSVMFGAVAIFGGLIILTLPETNNRPLPQTIEEIEGWFDSSSSQSSDMDAPTTPLRGAEGENKRPSDDEEDEDDDTEKIKREKDSVHKKSVHTSPSKTGLIDDRNDVVL